ncbi:MAG TPA: S8 family serine peptidase [Bdellovibrionota bacterium]|jgi:subtilisin family serine protease
MVKFIAIAAFLAMSATSAQAGEVLRLKATGVVRAEQLPALSASPAAGTDLFLFVVQWKSAVTEVQKAEVERLGLKLLDYIPDDAFVTSGSGSDAWRVSQLPFVRAVVDYRLPFKMEAELTTHGVFSFAEQVMVSVRLTTSADKAAVMGSLAGAVDAGNGILVGASSVSNVWKLAARSDVIWIERYIPMRSMDLLPSEMGITPVTGDPTRTGYESGVKILEADPFYARGFNGQGQVVAVADTGLDTGDASTISQDFQGQLKKGLAMGLGGKSWGDPMMHGTHCSGSILGNGRASNNLIRGGAYGAQLVMLGMWSDIMNNIMPPTLDKLYDAGYAEGARIQSNSWGAPNSNGRYDNWAALTDKWLFEHPDYLAMFAAGNDGADKNADGVIDENSLSSPGSAKNVLTVGASKNFLLEGGIQKTMKELRNGATKWGAEPIASSKLSEDQRGMAAFSSRGPAADGRIKPEIVAPGTNIVSARDKHPKADPASMSWGIYDDNYVYMGGTSMATPVAAGAAALVRQFLAQKTGNANVSSALMKATMANTAEDLFPGQFGEVARGQEQPSRRPNNHEGWGRVNLANLMNDASLSVFEESTGLATGTYKDFSVNVRGNRPLRVTLAYTDAPGAVEAQRTLVNDLDLLVTDPSGRAFYPNGRTDKDAINNMEQIDVLSPVAGTYKVTIKGANVPQGKNGAQPYALVISSGR